MSAAKVPPTLKPIAHYIKIANENASRDPVVYYWCLFHAVQAGMQIDRTSPDALQFLMSLLSTLETIKKQLAGNEAITSEIVGQAHLENFAMKLFDYADKKEKAGQIDKSVVHAFYTAGHVMDILSLFGEIDEPYASAKKYAKWKSTQIFACLRDGTPYVPSSQTHDSDPEQPGSSAAFGTTSSAAYPSVTNPMSYGATLDSTNSPHSYAPSDDGAPPAGFHPITTYPGSGVSAPARPQPPSHITPAPAPSSYVPPPSDTSSASGSSQSGNVPTFEEWESARKFAKYAISAIDYEDAKTCADNLKKALAVMSKYT